MSRAGSIYIGTSGWSYPHWRGPFYPEDLPAEEMLPFYAEHLAAVEINSSFYRLPTVAILQRWQAAVPETFLFTAKASRFLTHLKKLKEPRQPLLRLIEQFAILGRQLGPLVFQLPPHWGCNPQRLQTLLDLMPAGIRCSFEFRDPSWFNEQIYALLQAANAAFCIYQLGGLNSPRLVTADFVYLRLHGPDYAYQGDYDQPSLEQWKTTILNWSGRGLDVYCFFDNDMCGYAVRNARQLQEMIAAQSAPQTASC